MITDEKISERVRGVKRSFFAMRNGLLADTLRQGPASCFRIIFGLNLPQITEIARTVGYDRELADFLWANRTTRESLLLAPMLIDPASLTTADAIAMASEVPSPEVADILCHKLLRHLPDTGAIVTALIYDPVPLRRYTALRLMLNRVNRDNAPALADAAAREAARNIPLTRNIARQAADEAAFLLE